MSVMTRQVAILALLGEETFNPDQADTDGDGLGDVCDDTPTGVVAGGGGILAAYHTCNNLGTNGLRLQTLGSCISEKSTDILPSVLSMTSCQTLRPGSDVSLMSFNPDRGFVYADIITEATTTLTKISMKNVVIGSSNFCFQTGSLFPYTVAIIVDGQVVFEGSRQLTKQEQNLEFNLPGISTKTGSTIRIKISAKNGDFSGECGWVEFSDLILFGSCGSFSNTYERCGLSFVHEGHTITTTNTGNATILVKEKATGRMMFSCYAWLDSPCKDSQVINLAPNTAYLVTMATYNPHCEWIEEIVTPTSLSQEATSRMAVGTAGEQVNRTWTLESATSAASTDFGQIEINPSATIQSADIQVYPNPARELINIDLGAYSGQQGQLNLLNSMGQQVSTLSIDQLDDSTVQWEIGQISKGFYYLQVVIDGELKDMQKIVIDRR